MDAKWLNFFNGFNTIIIKDEKEFNKFKDFLDCLGLGYLLNNTKSFLDWKYLARINNKCTNYIIFEYQPGKGLSFGNTKEESEKWYGEEPYGIEVFDSFYENSKLFSKDNKIKNNKIKEDIEIEK